jgi:transposase
MSPTTRPSESTAAALYVSLELGGTTWVVVSTTSVGQSPRRTKVRAGDTAALAAEIARAGKRFHLAALAPVHSCYEAGGDGFWLHRWLEAHGVHNVVVDSASIRVSRRRREAKTDRLDAEALVRMLIRAVAGEGKVWSVVHVPTPEAEDRRQVSREWEAAKTDRRRAQNRIGSLLATQGISRRVTSDLVATLSTLQTGDGRRVGPLLEARLIRECAHLAAVEARCATLATVRQQQLRQGCDAVSHCARQLREVKGIGDVGAEMLSAELFGTRTFQNGRQLGALVGLAPTPYRSDQKIQEQGHSRAGRGALRGLMTQLAWGWLRFQPQSALTRWFHARFAKGPRLRRIGIVAVARKLLIALWHYVAHGIVPEGAALRA